MTLLLNPTTKNYEADFKGGAHGRLHVSLRTKRKTEAMTLHAAVERFYAAADVPLMGALRRRAITVQQIAQCVRANRSFETLRPGSNWPTLEAAVEEYLDFVKHHPKRSLGTYRNSKSSLEQIRDFVATVGDERPVRLGDAPLDALTSTLVFEFVKAQRGEVSGYTLTLKLGRLSTLYNWYLEREPRLAREEKRAERVLHSPVLNEWMAEKSEARTRFLEHEEVERLVAATPDELKFPVLIALLSGLRINEVVTLRPRLDIDLANRLVIVQPHELWPGKMWFPKNRKRREVPFPMSLVPVIERHLEEFASPQWMIPSRTREDRPRYYGELANDFLDVVEHADLVPGRDDPFGVTFHTLRHTFASQLVMLGVDLKTIATLMGHSTTTQVERTYGHLSPDHKRRAIAQLGDWFLNVSPTEVGV